MSRDLNAVIQVSRVRTFLAVPKASAKALRQELRGLFKQEASVVTAQ